MTTIIYYCNAQQSGAEICCQAQPTPQPYDPERALTPKNQPFDGFEVIFPSLASEDEEQEICDRIVAASLRNDCVTSARVMEYDGSYIVAMLTAPFYQKSERDRARQLIEAQMREDTGIDSLYVTFSVDVFRRIRPGMSNEEKRELCALLGEM